MHDKTSAHRMSRQPRERHGYICHRDPHPPLTPAPATHPRSTPRRCAACLASPLKLLASGVFLVTLQGKGVIRKTGRERDSHTARCMSHWYICVTNGLSRDGEDERRARRGPDMRPAATAGQGEGPARWLDPNRSSHARAVDARPPLPWSPACWWHVAERALGVRLWKLCVPQGP